MAIDRREIRPSTPLKVILPSDGRRETWRGIQAAMKLKVPNLQHTSSTLLSLLAIGVITAMAPGIYARVGFGWIVMLFFLGIVLGGILIKLSPSLAVEFPNQGATVDDLARDVLAVNHARLVEEVGGWNKKDLWESLCRVIVIQTSNPPEMITPEARIVADLGID